MSSPTTTTPVESGILVAFPHYHTPNPTPTETLHFLRWTKLHFRDLLNISHAAASALSPAPETAKVIRECRFNAVTSSSEAGPNKAEEGKEKKPQPHLYTTHVTDLRIFQSSAYTDDVSRRLDLENTRTLEDGEEAVGEGVKEGASVFDLVGADFGVFREVEVDGTFSFILILPHFLPLKCRKLSSPPGSRQQNALTQLTYRIPTNQHPTQTTHTAPTKPSTPSQRPRPSLQP